jgi:hypothetical protein
MAGSHLFPPPVLGELLVFPALLSLSCDICRLATVRDQRDFIAGVVILTILVEGVLAPSAELSRRESS